MRTWRLNDWFTFTVLGFVGLGATSALAVSANVSIVDFAFNPSAVSINVNDSVTWTWAGSFSHSSTSDNTNLWNSGILGNGATFSHTFKSAGSFPYHCVVHPFMTASVTVHGQTATPIMLGAAKMTSTGTFQFTYSATQGLNYAVDRSADLLNWQPVSTNSATSSQVTFTDTAATGLANFYRVRLVTGP